MITAELLRNVPLLREVPDTELGVIAARAADVHLRPNEWLIQEGEVPAFFMVLSGRLAVSKSVGAGERILTHYVPGDYAGEVPLLLGSAAIAGLRAVEPSRVARLDQSDFRELIVSCRRLNAQLLQMMAMRVSSLGQVGVSAPVATVTLIGHRYDIACHALRDFLARNQVSFRWYDPRDPQTRTNLPETPGPDEVFPVVELSDGSRLVTPTVRELAKRLGMRTAAAERSYDLAIVGGGPAGLAAAVYGASEGLRTILVEREAPGGQAATSSRIENYLGFPTGVSGDELGSRALQQARRFGVEILVAREVVGIDTDPGMPGRAVLLDEGERVDAAAIVVANGVSWRRLELPGADTLVGRGLYYGAARTEAQHTLGRDIFLIGGGNSAGQAAMFFSNYARSVTLLVRGASLASSMSHYLIEQLGTKANVQVRTKAQAIRFDGTDHLEAILVEDVATGKRQVESADAVFVFIGADAETSWLPELVIRDERGYVCTGRDVMDLVAANRGRWPLERDPYLLETSVPGVFAAGDVRHGSIKRVASGVGEGSMAIAFVHQYLAERAASGAH